MHQVFKMYVASFTDTELLSFFSFETIHKIVMAVKSVSMLLFYKSLLFDNWIKQNFKLTLQVHPSGIQFVDRLPRLKKKAR